MTFDDRTEPASAGPAAAHRFFSRFTKPGRFAVRWLPAALIVVAILGAWEGYVHVFNVERWFLPAPSVIATTIGEDYGLISRHTWVTLEEVIIGFTLALVGGVFLASCIVLSRTLERAVYPIIIASPTIPWLVVAPLLLIWFGHGLAPKVIVVALIAFFPIVVNTVDGLRSVDPELVNLMRTLEASRWQIFMKVQLPSAMPFLFSGTKVTVAVSVIGAVVGEWVGSSEGLGYFIIRSKSQFLTERVFAGIVVLSAMGIALFVLVGVIERLAIPWWHSARRQRTMEQR